MDNIGTEWERLEHLTEKQIYSQALSDRDNPPLEDLEKVKFLPLRKIPGNTLSDKFAFLRKQTQIENV